MRIQADTAAELKDPAASAEVVGLQYVTDEQPGIRRERRRAGFSYRTSGGGIVKDPATLRRIQSLAIPPAWTGVWICSRADGHLQATGRDDRGRKQFRYHPRWREIRDETKYAHMIAFARALPKIRRRVKQDLALPGLPRNKVLAAVVQLLELSLIRIGNDEYARANDSFGLTTLRDRHVKINGPSLRFHFRGKGGKWHDVDIEDHGLARIVKRCQDLPGQELFQFIDDDRKRQDVRSGDVNDYLREITGRDFTAKDFRTWAGTVLAAVTLRGTGKAGSRAQALKNIVSAVGVVAGKLGNTPAVCRKCYIHPHVLDAYLEGAVKPAVRKARGSFGLDPDEAGVLALLQQRRSLEVKLARSLRKEKAARSLPRHKKAFRPRSAPRK